MVTECLRRLMCPLLRRNQGRRSNGPLHDTPQEFNHRIHESSTLLHEMDLIPSDNNMECIEDESAQQLLHPCTSDIGESSQHLLFPCTSVTGDIFGDPEVLPRVGDQYQAQIPPLLAEYDHSQLVKKPDIEVMVNILNTFFLGLPIPIMWVHDEVENLKQDVVDILCSQADGVNINGLVKLENSEECQISLNDENTNIKVEPLNTALGDGKGGEMSGLQLRDDKMDVDLILPQDRKAQLDQRGKGYCPLPGSLGESWSDIERDSLLLGLYIFGKNFLLVKKFVESKEMGDILSFYYGKFYQSNGYHKWSECRKTRSRRCIHGQRIFTGGRQQELLSRLFPRVAEECQIMLVEVSRTFGERKISLEEYVFTLKDAVGINMLIEEVGIGRGKQDLTRIALEPIKTNQVFPLRPELPNGKACSSLSCRDIIKFLTGDFLVEQSSI
ncbi:hypothetical protein L1049_004963 [Liquidambar formosana]|uniref:SANT domain-containing protein n=1 Tax=Liquidambar formosana TaxID=63359 RepID=A0AAP0RPC6_LIQFO